MEPFFTVFHFPWNNLNQKLLPFCFWNDPQKLWAPCFRSSHTSGPGSSKQGWADGKRRPTSVLEKDRGFAFQPTVAIGNGTGIFKDKLEISNFMGGVLCGNIFTGANEKATLWTWPELCYRTDLVPQLPTDYANHLILQLRKQSWSPGRMLQTPIQCFYMTLNTWSKIPMVARQPSCFCIQQKSAAQKMEAAGNTQKYGVMDDCPLRQPGCPVCMCLTQAWLSPRTTPDDSLCALLCCHFSYCSTQKLTFLLSFSTL